MKYLEAKALVAEIENKADAPVEEDKWESPMSPEAYLARWPEGPQAELARRIIEARDE